LEETGALIGLIQLIGFIGFFLIQLIGLKKMLFFKKRKKKVHILYNEELFISKSRKLRVTSQVKQKQPFLRGIKAYIANLKKTRCHKLKSASEYVSKNKGLLARLFRLGTEPRHVH